MKAFERSKKPY